MTSNRRLEFLGVGLAVLWITAALPDIFATYAGDRLTNDISFTPAWLKAVRDVYTLFLFVFLSRSGSRRKSSRKTLWRCIAVIFAMGYLIIGLSRGIDLMVSIRGILWIPTLAWAMTADAQNVEALKRTCWSSFRIFIPASIGTAFVLGVFGSNMYFEGFGIYQRNPGLMLSPSATAYLACLMYLMLSSTKKAQRIGSLMAGLLSLSGVFYLMAALLFGRLKRYFYVALFIVLFCGGLSVGLTGIVSIASNAGGVLRNEQAVSNTLGTRLLIVSQAVNGLTPLGQFPLGLNVAVSQNVAVNQNIETFFPDNAYLAAIYAFGIAGGALIICIMVAAYKVPRFGCFLLIFVAGFFYVWFENILMAGLTGLALNKYYWKEIE